MQNHAPMLGVRITRRIYNSCDVDCKFQASIHTTREHPEILVRCNLYAKTEKFTHLQIIVLGVKKRKIMHLGSISPPFLQFMT